MHEPINNLTFKQAVEALRSIEANHGHEILIQEIVSRRLKGYTSLMMPKLSHGEHEFLHRIGMKCIYRSKIGEWEIELI